MASVITTKFKLHQAEQFFEAFSETSKTNIYLFIGQSWPWPSELTPPVPADDVRETEYSIWKRMFGIKKVEETDISYVSDRYNWSFNTVYEQYEDNNSTMWANNFYVVTDDFNVYKCLHNANGNPSFAKPTSTANTPATLSDGYTWKYIFTMTAAKAQKFLSTNYLPTQTLSADDGSLQWDVQQTASNSAIENVEIISGGSSYVGSAGIAQAGNTTTITLESGASGSDAEFVGSDVFVVSGTGAGQKREIVTYVGATKVATVNNVFSTAPDNSSGYNVGPKTVVEGDGESWNGYSTITSGRIDTVTVVSPGTGFTRGKVIATANSGVGANLYPHISMFGGHGIDAVKELASHNVMINIRLEGDESGLITPNNDFRVIGLISDPIVDSTGLVANSSVYNQTTTIDINTPVGIFSSDEYISGGTSGANGFVVAANSTVVSIAGIEGTFVGAETLTGNTSGSTAVVTTVTEPLLRRYSGNIMYKENRVAVVRASDQVEDIKLIVEF